MLKQTSSFQLQVCFSMYDLLVDTKYYRLTNIKSTINSKLLCCDNSYDVLKRNVFKDSKPASRLVTLLVALYWRTWLVGLLVIQRW